jgi:hypothetical protein
MTTPWLLVGALFVGLGIAGGHAAFSTLSLAVCVTLITLTCDVVRRRPRTVRLLDVWCFAFVYLFGSDALVSLPFVREDFGSQLTAAAEGFIVAAFGAALLGYAVADASVPPRRTPAASLARSRRRRELLALLVLSTMIVGYFIVAVSPSDLMTLRSARSGTGVQGPAFVAVVAAMIVHAALTARALMGRRRSLILAYPAAVTALSFVILYSVGTRYFLGFFGCAVLFYAAGLTRPFSGRRVASFALAVVALAGLQGTMRILRGTGLGGAEAGSLAAALGRPETYVSSEGMLRVHAWVHEKGIFEEAGRAPEHAFLLYWWVPRSVWPDKPTMDGYWLAHEVMADGDVGAGHNVAGGFVLPALLDFGPRVGILVCLLYGLVLSGADRFMVRHGDPASPASVFAAFLPFAVFFAMRSPQTSALFLESCIIVYLPIFLFVRGRRRARRRTIRKVAHARVVAPVAVPMAAAPAVFRGRR